MGNLVKEVITVMVNGWKRVRLIVKKLHLEQEDKAEKEMQERQPQKLLQQEDQDNFDQQHSNKLKRGDSIVLRLRKHRRSTQSLPSDFNVRFDGVSEKVFSVINPQLK